jgi:hypothetical protein
MGINAYAQNPEIKRLLRGACYSCHVRPGVFLSGNRREIEEV